MFLNASLRQRGDKSEGSDEELEFGFVGGQRQHRDPYSKTDKPDSRIPWMWRTPLFRALSAMSLVIAFLCLAAFVVTWHYKHEVETHEANSSGLHRDHTGGWAVRGVSPVWDIALAPH